MSNSEETKTPTKRRIVKIIGNILAILSVVFVLYRLVEMGGLESFSFTPDDLFWIVLFSAVYGLLILIYCLPWRGFVRVYTGARPPFLLSSYILSKSNIMKYIPGNIFQYVGRNELALRLNLSHSDVALATVTDVMVSVAAVFGVGALFYGDSLRRVFSEYSAPITTAFLILLAILIATAILIIMNRRIQSYVRKIFSRNPGQTLRAISFSLLFYAVNILINAGLFLLVLMTIIGMEMSPSRAAVIVGAYLLAWLAGFLVPGAPGGIGVREAVFTLLLGSEAGLQGVLAGIVVYRVVTTVGDLFGFAFAKIIYSASNSIEKGKGEGVL